MIIACDVDNVLNNLTEVMLEVFNSQYGKSYTIEDLPTYKLENCLEPEEAKQMKTIFDDKNIWSKVRPISGAQDGLQKLIRDGHQVYLVTNNSPYTYGYKYDWVRHYFPFIDPSKIVCMSDKWFFKADLMIEDCFETLTAKPYYHRILMDCPWNQSTKDYVYGIYRCNNWSEIIAAVNEICEEE